MGEGIHDLARAVHVAGLEARGRIGHEQLRRRCGSDSACPAAPPASRTPPIRPRRAAWPPRAPAPRATARPGGRREPRAGSAWCRPRGPPRRTASDARAARPGAGSRLAALALEERHRKVGEQRGHGQHRDAVAALAGHREAGEAVAVDAGQPVVAERDPRLRPTRRSPSAKRPVRPTRRAVRRGTAAITASGPSTPGQRHHVLGVAAARREAAVFARPRRGGPAAAAG